MTVSEAKAQLSALLERVLAGEEIAIGRRGRAEVQLVAIDRSPKPRPLGVVNVADYWMSDDFDEPLEDLEADFDSA